MKKLLLVFLLALQTCAIVVAQTDCGDGKLSLFLGDITTSQNFLKDESVSSTDLSNYTAEVGDYYLNDTKAKFFVLNNVTTAVQNNVILKYTPHFNSAFVKLNLSFAVVNSSDVTAVTAQPFFVDITGQPFSVSDLSSGTDYYIQIPAINPNYKIIILEKLISYACIPAEGMTMTIDIAEKKADNTFQTVCGTTGLTGGVQVSKLITKFRETAINNVIHTDITKGTYCYTEGQNSQEYTYTYSFEHPEKNTSLTDFTVYFFPYFLSPGRDISMIEWGNGFTIKLVTTNSDGTTKVDDLRQLYESTQRMGVHILDNSLINCPAQTANTFLEYMNLVVPEFKSNQKIIFTFKEYICCPKQFGINKERGWFFQYQFMNECNKPFLKQDPGFEQSNDAVKVRYNIGATDLTLTSTVSPPAITAIRLQSNPQESVGLENYTATTGLGVNAQLLLNAYHDLDIRKYSLVAVLRYENGLRYTQYDANNIPINGTQLDYLAWNSSFQGTINPFFPYHDFIFRDASNQIIPGTKLAPADNWYNYFTQNSTYANNFVFQYDNSVFNDLNILNDPNLPDPNKKYVETIELTKKLSNATFNWSFEPDCHGVPADHSPNYQLEFYLIPADGSCNTCAIPLDMIKKSVEVDCPGCKFTGGDVYVTSNQRVTLGEIDANNDGKPDSNTPTLINPALNYDSDPSNDYNLTTAMVGDTVQLHHVYYLTEGQGFPYTDANGTVHTISMDDAIFGTDALVHSYLEVQIPKGDSIQLYEDANYMAEVRLLDNSGHVIKVTNIDLIDESTHTYTDWIISHKTIGGTNQYIFDLSIDKLKGNGTLPVSAFHSGYVLDIRFYVRIAGNIKQGADGRGIVSNTISFRPYFSAVDYNNRDTRYLDGEFTQIDGYTVDGDPYYEAPDGTIYTWPGFNSADRLTNDYNNSIAMNSHKLLLCGAGQTVLNTVAVYLGTYFSQPGTMWSSYFSYPACTNLIRYVGQIDVGKNTTQIFPREYRQSPNGHMFFFSIPAGTELSSVDVVFGPYGGGSDNNYVNQHYNATAVNTAGDANFSHVQLENQNADFIQYSIDLNALTYHDSNNSALPFYRGDEREEVAVYVHYETICTNNALSVPDKYILAVGPANKDYWPRLELNQAADYIDPNVLTLNDQYNSNALVKAPAAITLLRANNVASIDAQGGITYPISLSNINNFGAVVPNAFIVIQYDRTVLNTITLYNTNNQSISSFDVLVNGTIYNKYFYNLNSSDANSIAANTVKDYTLKASFNSCPDNNFRIYIGYGYSCHDPITSTTDFSQLCNYTPPSDRNPVIIFVKDAQLSVVNAGYENPVCGAINYNYSIKSNNGIAKDIQSIITLPAGFTIPDMNNMTVEYGTQKLAVSEYTFVQDAVDHQIYKLTINNQIGPFYNTSFNLYPNGVDLINISIGLAYTQGCNQPVSSVIHTSVTGNSICGSSASAQSDFTMGALQACTNANTLTGVITKTDGSATFICMDATGTPIPTLLKVTPSNASLTYTYQWYVQSGTQYISIAGATSNTYSTSQTGWFKAVFTDVATGCFGSAVTHVIDNIPPPVDPFVCAGENPPLVLNGLNGVSGSYSASWYTDAAPDVLIFNINQAGYYYAMAIIPGCTLRTATPVHVEFKESPNPYVFAGNSVFYHLNNDVHIEVANPAANDLSLNSIRWSQDTNKHDLAPFTVNKDGKYTVTVTNNATQCSVSSTAVVASPKIKLVQYGNYCQNTTGITLRAEANFAAGNYSWYKVNSVNPLNTTFISNGSDCFIPVPGGLYMVSNDLDQTCSGSIFYINLDNGINDPANSSFNPSDLVPVGGTHDGDFESIATCTDARDFQSTFICQDQIPDFNTSGYEQNLIGHYIITNKASQWNSPGGNNLWNGYALANPNSTIPSLQQQFMIVDGEVGNGNQTIWTKTIDISQYPSLLQSFLFKASIRDIDANASSSSNKREIPEASVRITFLTASGASVEAASVDPVQVLYNSNNTQWIDLTAIVDRFNYYQGCEDPVIPEDFTQAKIEIVLSGGGAIGRDLGVDEIVFIPAKLCGGTSGNASINMSQFRLARTCNASLVKLMDKELHTCYGVPVTFALNTFTSEQLTTEWFDNSSYSGVPVSTGFTLTVSPKMNKQYYLRVTDPINNCFYTDKVTVYVTQPEIHIASDADNVCMQPDLTFQVDNFTILGNIHYKWYQNGTALTQGYDSRTITLSGAVNGDVIKCELVNQCKNDDDSPLILFSNEINIKGNVSNADAGADITICSGESTPLGISAISGNTYQWSPSATLSDAASASPVASPTVTATYTLQMTDVNGCVSTDDVDVIIRGALPLVDAGADKNSCPGGITVPASSVSGSTIYTWSPATGVSDIHALAPQLTPTVTTEYTLEAEDAFGCKASDNMQIVILAVPQINLAINGNTITSQVSGGQPPYQYSWFKDASAINGETNATYTAIASGLYDLHVKDQNTCENSSQINVVVTAIVSSGILNGFLKIYPVPASNTLNIDYADEVLHLKSIKLFDVTGRELVSVPLVNQNSYILDVSDLASGLYIIKLYCADGNEIVSKILVEK